MGLYKTNKQAKTGTIIECPVCHKKFKKIQYSQAFCCGHCKDKYHNMVDGDRHKYSNVSKISRTIKIEKVTSTEFHEPKNIKMDNDSLEFKYFNLENTILPVGKEKNSLRTQNALFSIGIGRNTPNGIVFEPSLETYCAISIEKSCDDNTLSFYIVPESYLNESTPCHTRQQRLINCGYLYALIAGNIKNKYTDERKYRKKFKNKNKKVPYWTAMARQMERLEKNREKWEMEHDDYDNNPYDNYEGGYDDRDEVADGLHS